MCVRMWPCSSQGREKAFPHILQTQGSVWLRICILRAPRLTYSFSQYLQLKDFLAWASQCNCLCLESPAKVEYALAHWAQRKRSAAAGAEAGLGGPELLPSSSSLESAVRSRAGAAPPAASLPGPPGNRLDSSPASHTSGG